ncbi:ATP-binding cassette domain-containing protein [Undibacterium sp. Jales W-56]|uniref:ABC transporter ATP-binding protein n=1 Tax=Undibacterium sp. Jales W-56 TaxID=2897325 RepID=UPI0021D18505|nr:ATP-binding cassette domain-containing protein [Undibacterium sp. Jales W-56]MCU6435857.1 ATP-binding cassette domain-containing protein [Undibacterium sp. Jales W-56]
MIELNLQKKLLSASGTMHLDMQINVQRGELLGLFGESGAGKTTLLRMLAGLTMPDSGRIVVDGICWFDSVKKIMLAPQQRSIGLVFQDYALFPNMSVRANLAYALSGKDSQQTAWLDQLLSATGLSALQDRMPAQLSGGQQQRVALARAIVRKPQLLLLDEPLSALDLAMRSRLQDELQTLHREFGLTTILVSHDIGEVFKLADKVQVLQQGRVVRSGTPAQVFLQQRLAGQLNLRAQVLAIRREEVVFILSLLVGQEIVEIIASQDEVDDLKIGAHISISTKAFSPLIFKSSA